MRNVKGTWKRGCRVVVAAITAGTIFQVSSCSIDDSGVINAFVDPGALFDLRAQLHEESLLGRVFDIDGNVDINFGEED